MKEIIKSITGITVPILLLIITAAIGFSYFQQEERFKMKVEIYTEALEVVNQEILSSSLEQDELNYDGTACGGITPLSYLEKNNTYTMLALVSKNPDIPRNYLEIMSPTTTTKPVKIRDDLITLIRKELGFEEDINLEDINDGHSFIVDLRCVKSQSQ